jgi:hypothetical protein
MTDPPYDFSALHRPMSSRETRERRRAILAGRSLWSALEVEHFAGIIVVGGLNLLVVIPVAVVSVLAAFSAAGAVQSAGDVAAIALLTVVVPIAAAAIVYFSMRALLIPPRWRAWVRMHRFAEENGIEFVREEGGVRLPGTLVPRRTGGIGPTRLYGGFRDAARGITLGDYVVPAAAPEGVADWLGVIEVRFGDDGDGGRLGHTAIQRMLGDTAGPWSIEIQLVAGAAVAVKHLPFRTRKAANLERAFRIAWAIHENAPSRRS